MSRSQADWILLCQVPRLIKSFFFLSGPLAERLALRDDILNEEGEQYDVILTT